MLVSLNHYYGFVTIFDIVAKTNIGRIIMISGINGGNCILSSMAKERVKRGIIDHAQILGMKSAYKVVFDGSNGELLVLSSSRQPYEPRIFKSLDGALAELLRIGLTEASIKIIDRTDSE